MSGQSDCNAAGALELDWMRCVSPKPKGSNSSREFEMRQGGHWLAKTSLPVLNAHIRDYFLGGV